MVGPAGDGGRRGSIAELPERLDGRYRVVRTIGQGGMGTVLEAHDEQLDRTVAVKVLRPHVAQRHGDRLRREAEALAKLSHPNVVQVYDVGEDDGQLFVVMELVHGHTLWRWQKQKRSRRELVEAYVQAGRGLAAAHAEGLVHRDFKPGNCIIGRSGRARVLDFGLARDLERVARRPGEVRSAEPLGTPIDERLTQTGAVLGTVAYMPLEQLSGQPADARSDQFSFCVSLFEALYGQRPFAAKTPYEQLEALMEGQLDRPRRRQVPPELWRVLRRGLAREPAGRWPSMDALVDALEVYGRPSRRRWWALGGLSSVVLAGTFMGSKALEPEPCETGAERMAAVWGEDARARVEQALHPTVAKGGPEIWEKVSLALDAYAGEWIEAHDDACADTKIRHEQPEATMDARMQCLDERLRELTAVVRVLAAGDVGADNAMRAIHRTLIGIERCSDPQYVDELEPLPTDPAMAAEIESLYEALAATQARSAKGDYIETLAEVEQIMARMGDVPYGPILVDVLWQEGWSLERLGRYEDAAEVLERAFFEARTWKRHHQQGLIVSRLIHVINHGLQRPREALKWVRHGEALLARTRDDTLPSVIYTDIANVHSSLGDYERGIEYLERALAAGELAFGPENLGMAPTYNNLGIVHRSLGDLDRALEAFERSLAIRRTHQGDRHPNLVTAMSNIGLICESRGDHERAEDLYGQIVSILEDALGPEHPRVAGALRDRARLRSSRGEYALAIDDLERALSLARVTRDQQLGIILLDLGTAQRSLGNTEQALESYQRALSVFEDVVGVGHPYVAVALSNLGHVYLVAEQYERALEYFGRARAIHRGSTIPDDVNHAIVLNNIAAVLVQQGDHASALEHYQEAMALHGDDPEPRDGLVQTFGGMGQMFIESGEPSRALEPLKRALRMDEQLRAAPEDRATIRFLLATAIYEAHGDHQHALALAQLARDELDIAEGDQRQRLAQIDRWLHRVRRDVQLARRTPR